MFGSKLKTWMENYIGRPKKKVQAETHKGKPNKNVAGGLILESSESLAQSDAGISSGSQQVLSSSTTDCKEGYSTATMDSDRSGLIHCHTAISLPSPESAYSTGYSTDETSPGGTAPPEYYINIRTGKHYFPSPAPTPTSPHPHTPFPHLHPSLLPPPSTNYLTNPPLNFNRPLPPPPPPTSHLQTLRLPYPPADQTHPQTHSASLRFFLNSPRREPPDTKKKSLSPSKTKKWFKQPFHRFAHRRTDSCDENNPKRAVGDDPGKGLRYLPPAQDVAASPRQRNRIKTNPWLPTAPTPTPFQQNLHAIFPRNRSCSNTPLQNRKAPHRDPPPSRPQHLLDNALDNALEPTDPSEEDLTFNEMMGTYSESYVYEKETDILSDSDPTDCDDYDSDSEAEKGGDERDSHDDELDFIDNASATDSSDDSLPPNTGRCTYHHLSGGNSFLCRGDRRHTRKDSDQRRSLRRSHEVKGRRERRRQGRVWWRGEEEERKVQGNERVGARGEARGEVEGELSLRRMVLRRVMGKGVRRESGGGGVVGGGGRGESGSEVVGGGGARVDLVLVDQEADERYRELIVEAENMFESLRNSPVVKGRKKMHLLDREERDGGGESVEVRKEREATCRRASEPKAPATPPKKSPKSLALRLPVETPKKPEGLRFESAKKSSFKARSSAHSPLDPLGPTFKNFAVFHPPSERADQILTTSSDDSDPTDKITPKPHPPANSSLVPIAFQSLDLGKPLAPYCPQSEPVKRKVYSCSKTYDRLLRHLENSPATFDETQPGQPGKLPLYPPPRPPLTPLHNTMKNASCLISRQHLSPTFA